MMMNSGNYYALDPVGSDIWARISDPKAVVELCNDLKLEYDAPRERIERDVLTLLGDLVAAGAVEIKS